MKRLLTTHSLLNSWEYIFKSKEEYQEKAYQSFLDTLLNRIHTPPTDAMLAGREFERLVTEATVNPDIDHDWIIGASEIADVVRGGADQVRMSRPITVNGTDYLLYGIFDWLKAGTIYDVKYKQSLSSYNAGDYYNNTQHRMYFALEDFANTFVYLISNGVEVYQEEYKRQNVNPIERTISEFEEWLKCRNLWKLYTEKWQSRG